jgi:SAM-dependent methyltransferase
MTAPLQIFDRRVLRERRNRAAADAEKQDFLLSRAADDLIERLGIVKRTFANVLVLGAHHGTLGRRLKACPGVETVLSLDSSPALLALCDEPRCLADEETLPLAPASVDLAVSAHALHTVNDLPGTLIQLRQALKPDGLLLATFPGGETLHELRAAWLAAELELRGGVSPRVAPFADVRDCGALLQRAGFALPVADSETVTVTYASPLALMAELKAMGMSNMLTERSRTPVTRRLLLRAAEIYAERFGLPGGRVPATFEILTLTGWVPHDSQPQPLAPGSAQMRLAEALGVKEGKV